LDAGTPSDQLWPSLAASLVPLVLGGLVTLLKPFIESPKEFKKGVDLQRKALQERHASKHAALLQHLRHIITAEIEPLRGDGREEPDLIGEMTSETFRLFTVFHRLDTLRLSVRAIYTGLLVSIFLAVLGALASIIWVDLRPWILMGGVALVVLQLGLIGTLYWASWKLDTYEDVT
jgi:hypothetical protein